MLVLLALSVPSVRADDICGGNQERKKTTVDAQARIAQAEKSGNQAALFLAYRAAAADECVSGELIAKARANATKLGRELAKAAEAKGLLYSNESLRSDGQTSAFRYFESIGDYSEANRVMLKAVQAKPDDLTMFRAAWGVDQGRVGPPDPNTDVRPPYTSPASYRQELQKIASANADRLMKAEEKDAQGFSGGATDVALAAAKSLEKLRTAAEWMKFLPGGEKPAKDRAEQRGDAIMKRTDPTFTQGNARGYYEFAGSARAKEKIALLDKKTEESSRALEKAGERVKGAFTQQSETEQKKFDKKKADLEKELGF